MASTTPPVPQENQQVQPVQAQQPIHSHSISGFQYTQVQQSIPSSCWTTEVLEKYLGLVKDNDDKNRSSLDAQRKREHQLAWAGTILVGTIILFGLYLVYVGNPFGKDLIGATVIFLSGYLAGQGQARKG
jgi:hypothetical protein